MELSTVVAFLCVFLLSGLLFVSAGNDVHIINQRGNSTSTSRDDASPYPSNFLFGTASSAYQVEGAFLSDGKGLNNWDVFTHKPGTVIDGSNGDVADDHYHRYQEDIELMDSLGVNSYRFSISWARILPKGRFGDVNPAGIQFYNNMIDALLRKGIEPFVSLFHYDLPQELEDRYGAWLSPEIQEDFRYYANICFSAFGDRVKYWITFNEPNMVVLQSYRRGIHPPARCSGSFGNCIHGDSEKEPFIASHNIILSHAAAVDLYRTNYQKEQRGTIGIVINAIWFEPVSNSTEDKAAVKRAQSFLINWYLDPIIFGKYPEEMTDILGSDMLSLTSKEQIKLKGSLDFIGINHYTSLYVKDCIYSVCEQGMGSSRTEGLALQSGQKDGVFIGEPTSMDWYYAYPQGMEKVVTYMKERYNNIPMFIAENGYGDENILNAPLEDFLNDIKRVDFMRSYLDSLATAIRKGADVRGYFVWSLLDNFEWNLGYTKRFGLYHVDYNATLKRTAKASASWFKSFIAKHRATKTYLDSVVESCEIM